MKNNYNNDLKKGSADRSSTGQKQGMPGGSIGRGDMSMGSRSSSGSGKQDAGSSEHKSARHSPGSDRS